MSDWSWEYEPDDPLDGLPPEAIAEVEQIARELAVRDSMLFPDGKAHCEDTPGLRRVERPALMLYYLTDVRQERVVITLVIWLG